MLLKAEKILSQKDILINASEDDIYRYAKYELAEKIIALMFEKGLIKTSIMYERDFEKGDIVKVVSTIRAYNPDD